MYLRSLSLSEFGPFSNLNMDFNYPGMVDGPTFLNNITLVVGDNGAGKTNLLKAIAISLHDDNLQRSGMVPYRLAKRPATDKSVINAHIVLRWPYERNDGRVVDEFKTRTLFHVRDNHDLDYYSSSVEVLNQTYQWDKLEADNNYQQIFSQRLPVLAYGATRRPETGDVSESSQRKMRGDRYPNVATLFEDYLAILPIEQTTKTLSPKQKIELFEVINNLTPHQLEIQETKDGLLEILFNHQRQPFSALSNGYRAFLVTITDMITRLMVQCDVETAREVRGIVLIDEIDLHLHLNWQRSVIHWLGENFPMVQFVITTHSALVAIGLSSKHLWKAHLQDGVSATVFRLNESVSQYSVDELLMSAVFGLRHTGPESEELALEQYIEGLIDS